MCRYGLLLASGHQALKLAIKRYIDKPTWSDEECWEVAKFVRNVRPDITETALTAYEDIEHLRSTLSEILRDFDILITADGVVVRQRPKGWRAWFLKNYGWVFGLISVVFMIIGLLMRVFWGI